MGELITTEDVTQAIQDVLAKEKAIAETEAAEREAALQARIDEEVKKALAEFTKAETHKGVIVTTSHESPFDKAHGFSEQKAEYRDIGSQLTDIMLATKKGDVGSRKRLDIAQKAVPTGLGESTGADGGFLLQDQFVAEIMTKTTETGILAGMCRQIPIGPNSNGLLMNAVDETSRATGSRWGGITGYWGAEAGTKVASKPKFRQMELKLKKLYAVIYATDELIEDSTAFSAVVNQGVSEEFGWLIDNAIVNGPGGGQPLGFMNSPAVVSVNGVAGQGADTIVYENIRDVWNAVYAPSRRTAAFLMNQECEPQLNGMTQTIGTGGVPVYLPANGISGLPYSTIYGRPVIPIEQAAGLGDTGDFMCVDLGQYLIIKKGEIARASSIHVEFLTDQTVFRFVMRIDGQPMWNSALTPANTTQSSTYSPFVILNSTNR